MDEGERVISGPAQQWVVGDSASLTRKPGDGRVPFAAKSPADAGKVDSTTAGEVSARGADTDAQSHERGQAAATEHSFDLTGLNIDGDSRPDYDAFGNAAAKAGLNQDQFREIGAWYQGHQAEQLAELTELDQEHAVAAVKTLQARWGHEYDANVAAIKGTLSKLPFGDAIMNTRLADGRALFNDPQAVQWFADIAKRLSTPGQKAAMSAEDERAAIEKFMRENRRAYDRDPGMQARYRDLLSNAGGERPADEETGGGLTDAEAKELQGIERFMRANRQAYNRDEAKQARMRQLYAQRGR